MCIDKMIVPKLLLRNVLMPKKKEKMFRTKVITSCSGDASRKPTENRRELSPLSETGFGEIAPGVATIFRLRFIY